MKIISGLAFIALAFASCSGGSNEKSVRDEDKNIEGAAKVEMSAGHKLFVNNCIQCHNIKTDKIGPALEGVMSRWNNDTARVYAFIRNSQEVIKKGDPRAVEVYEKYNHTMMTPMPHLTDQDINQILEYINTGKE